ncbi:two-component system, cell cycle response regulator [Palleronia salina]|uniref:diguanylate cyclase n=1 Tax=Palleronia salina TaxID=313368 RepID=A0A1M6L3T0_9RHOB|nr:diguanylate cyclase [Palleronia salina]SHJ65852.1 two-component system, cell cycle response regulator [Palleronia salina]
MPRRILIVEPTATHRIALKAALVAAHYEVRAVATGQEGIRNLRGDMPDAVIINGCLPDLTIDNFCVATAALGKDVAPPVLAIIDEDTTAARLAVLGGGASTVLLRPIDRGWLLTHLRSLLRCHETRAELRRRIDTAAQFGFSEDPGAFTRPARLAIVGGDSQHRTAMARALRRRSVDEVTLMTPTDAISASEEAERAPEVFLLCPAIDSESTLTLIAELRSRRGARRASIAAQYEPGDRAFAARALDQGVNGVIRSDASPEELNLRILRHIRIKRQTDALRDSVDANLMMAAHDPLTGLFNRRYGMRYLSNLAKQPHSQDRGYGQILMDVDLFKTVNDTHGHAAGDQVLRQIARRLQDNVREGDLLARYGGEEFLVALPDCSIEEARIAAERLRVAICGAPMTLPGGSRIQVTLSIGVACGREAPDALLERADRALYAAKAAGRNRVALADATWPAAGGMTGRVVPLITPRNRVG